MNDIYKGNLSADLKRSILDVLHTMLDSANVDDRKFAITTLLTHKRELSEWPANDWSHNED